MKPTINVPLLRKVIKYILRDGKRLNMFWWIARKSEKPGSELFDFGQPHYGSCGTAACIAGWTVILSGEKPAFDIPAQARMLLGLTDVEVQPLFCISNWPPEFRDRWDETGLRAFQARAKIAADRIEQFIKLHGGE